MDPSTKEIEAYCRQYLNDIYVRDLNEFGKWDSLSLAELPESTREQWIVKFCRRGVLPVRVRRD